MFRKLTFASIEEKNEFEKYKKLKGIYLHKQVYDILLQVNDKKNVTYYALSSFIRYDKNLRDMLYKYLGTAEEYLRALVCEKYDVPSNCSVFKAQKWEKLAELSHKKQEDATSNLFYKLELDFSALMTFAMKQNLIHISEDAKKSIQKLRNETMHHSLLLLGKNHDLAQLDEHFKILEKRLNALLEILPEEYKEGFMESVKRLNGYPRTQYLSIFYLEVQDGTKQICIKK